jgi:hypothetical protein
MKLLSPIILVALFLLSIVSCKKEAETKSLIITVGLCND